MDKHSPKNRHGGLVRVAQQQRVGSCHAFIGIGGGQTIHGAYLKAIGGAVVQAGNGVGGGNASTADFIDVAEDVSGRELDELFDAWLNSETPPPPPQSE